MAPTARVAVVRRLADEVEAMASEKTAMITPENGTPVGEGFPGQLAPATDRGLKAQDRVKKAIEDFGSTWEATRSANLTPFDNLAAATETDA